MPKPNRLLLAKDDILALFSMAQPAVYTKAQLATLIAKNRHAWHLSGSTTTTDLIAFLAKYGSLRTRTLRACKYGHEIVRYCWATPSPYQLALSIQCTRISAPLPVGIGSGLRPLLQDFRGDETNVRDPYFFTFTGGGLPLKHRRS
jgi:hypothetical protein